MPDSKQLNSLSSFPERYKGLSFDKCATYAGNTEALKMARSWAEGRIDNLFFYGPQGTGKTHLAAAAMAERRGVPEYVYVPTMLLNFQASVQEHDELELIGAYSSYSGREYSMRNSTQFPLRLFDDVAAHRISDFGLEMFGILLEKLYSRCSSGMIFTSNLSPKQIMETMGERIASRLLGLAEDVKVDGDDQRLKKYI